MRGAATETEKKKQFKYK